MITAPTAAIIHLRLFGVLRLVCVPPAGGFMVLGIMLTDNSR
jgi:hypothetical protein